MTLARPIAAQSTQTPLTVEVVEGSLGRSLTVPVRAQWELTPLTLAVSEAVVTSIDIEPGTSVDVGTRLMTADLRPMTVAQGAIPAFRDLTQTCVGSEVEQLQHFLSAKGFFSATPNGTFSQSTTTAVKAWQKSLSLEQTGTVLASDLVFIPSLPRKVVLAEGIRVGSHLTAGDDLLHFVAETPSFTAVLDESQMSLLPDKTEIIITAGERTWNAVMGSTTTSPDKSAVLGHLSAGTSDSICGDQCEASVPVRPDGTATMLRGEAVIVPNTIGAKVPAAAVRTNATGEAFVRLLDGGLQPVKVLVTQDGQSIVSGVSVGTTILASPAS
jgi:peptidoglycan hydrolase-like protein with peptidoglycan-binding domain